VSALTDSSLCRLKRRSRAQALIEFSLILPVMLLMAIGLISFGRAFVFGVSVQEGTRQAARLAASASVNTAVTLTNADVLGRLVAASNPALVGCTAQTGAQSCNGGNWNVTVNVVGPSSASYATLEAARAANDLSGAQVTITITGAVAVLPGVSTGLYGLSLPQVGIQGQTAMVVL
jgi:Flp pilus assembly protein TadG